VLILDDIIGFIGEAEFREFAMPCFKKLFSETGSRVNFLHNDADGLITAANLKEMGVNMFNFSFNHSMGAIRELAGPEVVLVGNIPGRDVLASGTPDQVKDAVKKAFGEISNHERIIWSAGGGMPPFVKNENISAFMQTVRDLSKQQITKSNII
jgi:uroporphyrinogen decarboxylase